MVVAGVHLPLYGEPVYVSIIYQFYIALVVRRFLDSRMAKFAVHTGTHCCSSQESLPGGTRVCAFSGVCEVFRAGRVCLRVVGYVQSLPGGPRVCLFLVISDGEARYFSSRHARGGRVPQVLDDSPVHPCCTTYVLSVDVCTGSNSYETTF